MCDQKVKSYLDKHCFTLKKMSKMKQIYIFKIYILNIEMN